MGVSLFSPVTVIGQEVMVLICTGEGSGWILGKFVLRRNGDALAQLPRGWGLCTCGDVTLRDLVSGHSGMGWDELDEFRGVFQP